MIKKHHPINYYSSLLALITAYLLHFNAVNASSHDLSYKSASNANIDLVIEDIRFEPQVLKFDEFYVGKVFGLSFTIRDVLSTARVDSSLYANAVYLSKDSVLDPSDILLGEFNNDNLAIYLPSITKTGVYRFFFVADSKNAADETNEDNNVTFKDIKVNGLSMDYSISGLAAYFGNDETGDSLTISYYLTRKQYSYLSGKFTSYAGIYLSEDTILDKQSDLLLKYDSIYYYFYEGGNRYESRKFKTKVPADVRTGNYYVLGSIGIDNPVVEINDQNNFTWVNIAVQDTNEFRIKKIELAYDTIIYHPETIMFEPVLGKMIVDYNCTVCGGPKATIETFISKDSIIDYTDLRISVHKYGLYADTRSEFEFNLGMLTTEYSGKNYIIGRVEPYSFSEGIQMHTQFFVKPIYIRNLNVDLYPNNIDIDVSNYIKDQTITVKYGISNSGKDLARGFSIEQVVLSKDTIISDDDISRINSIQTNIGSNAYDPLYPVINGKYPNLIPGQTYYFIFFFNNPAASQGHSEESNYTNNNVAVPFTIDPITSTASSLASEVTVYPIPANEILNIDLGPSTAGDVKIRLINTLGKEVFVQNFLHSKAVYISTASIPAGLYALEIISAQGTIEKKVVIE